MKEISVKTQNVEHNHNMLLFLQALCYYAMVYNQIAIKYTYSVKLLFIIHVYDWGKHL